MTDKSKHQKRGGKKSRRITKKRREMGDKNECGVTIQGLHKWYELMFEKLGWIILAEHRGYTDKTTHYKKSLQHLKSEIESKIEQMVDQDTKTDLKIMHHNLDVLIEHANKDF